MTEHLGETFAVVGINRLNRPPSSLQLSMRQTREDAERLAEEQRQRTPHVEYRVVLDNDWRGGLR